MTSGETANACDENLHLAATICGRDAQEAAASFFSHDSAISAKMTFSERVIPQAG